MINLSKASIEPEDMIRFLKSRLQIKDICHNILCQKVIAQAAEERKIHVSQEEVEEEANRQRYAKRLEKAADTLSWLADQMVTADDWEAGIYQHLLTQKLVNALFDSEVEKSFAQNKLDYEQVVLYQIVFAEEALAQEVFYQIEEGEISFYQAANLYDIEKRRRLLCGYEGRLYRHNLKPDLAAVVFGATPGEVVGPVCIEEGYHLIRVEEFIEAELTPERQHEIKQRMFQEWLMSELNYMLHNSPMDDYEFSEE